MPEPFDNLVVDIIAGLIVAVILAGLGWLWRRGKPPKPAQPLPPQGQDSVTVHARDHTITLQNVEVAGDLNIYVDGLPQAEPQVREPFEKGRRLQDAEKHEAAIEQFEKAFAVAEDDRQRSALHILIGNSLALLSRFAEAEGHYQQALTSARHIGDKEAEAAALGNLGIASAERRRPAEGKEYFEKALSIHEETGNRRGQANQLCNLGIVCAKEDDLQQGEEFLKQALHMQGQVTDRAGQAKSLSNLGNVYLIRAGRGEPGYLDKAAHCYKKALKIAQQIGSHHGQAAALMGLGHVYVLRSGGEKAQECYERALAIHQHIGNRLGQAKALANLGVLHARGGAGSEALRYMREARRIFAEVGAAPDVQKADKLIAGLEAANPLEPKRPRNKPPPKKP